MTPIVTASSASASPISSPSASSQLFATPAAVGKQVAGRLAFNPKWSPAPACLLSPCGPSDITIDGIPYFSKSTVSHVFFPDIIIAFSASVIFLINFSYFRLILKPTFYCVLCYFVTLRSTCDQFSCIFHITSFFFTELIITQKADR